MENVYQEIQAQARAAAEELLAAAEATTQEAAEGTAHPATPEGPATVGA